MGEVLWEHHLTRAMPREEGTAAEAKGTRVGWPQIPLCPCRLQVSCLKRVSLELQST